VISHRLGLLFYDVEATDELLQSRQDTRSPIVAGSEPYKQADRKVSCAVDRTSSKDVMETVSMDSIPLVPTGPRNRMHQFACVSHVLPHRGRFANISKKIRTVSDRPPAAVNPVSVLCVRHGRVK
jgi:hypothetical protein